jgi:hypothetical protein
MQPVAVRIFHAEPAAGAGPLTMLMAAARRRLADTHATAFRRLGQDDVEVVSDPPDDTPFGARLRRVAPRVGGVIALGSGAAPLATIGDLRDFVRAAERDGHIALTNNRYSADVVAISNASVLASLPDLPADNALPRWLAEVGGFAVADLARRWRLQIDYDSPLDLLIAGARDLAELAGAGGLPNGGIARRIEQVASVAGDSRAEIFVAGRTSTATLRWLERRIPARTRALVEERGLRASTDLAGTGGTAQRPPRSLLGHLLDADGAGALGAIVTDVADAAVIDSRVLLAHRLGADERSWPVAEDRYASDLLLPDLIADRWLRTLTDAALDSPVPILLGGHTLVGPGLRLVLRRAATA